MNAPFLKIDNLSKNYGETRALSEISLSLHTEELLVILGPTGAGKTTLLRIIAGLEAADTGRITVNGTDITHQLPAERDIALVFQNFSLYPNKTVRQNLEFPLQAPGRNLSKTDIANRISHTADLLRITPLLDRPATHLSGGEMQRVAIGRAIVRQPQLFLLDEPLTNLDAKLREVLRVELIRLQRDLHTPMIYVTHDRVEALSMGDRIAVLSEGKILQIGSPEEISDRRPSTRLSSHQHHRRPQATRSMVHNLEPGHPCRYQQPNSPTVARQLGYPPINTIDVHKQQDQWFTTSNQAILAADHNAPSNATLGIRAEDISPQGGEIPAAIEVVEDLGASTILLADWAGQPIQILTSGEQQWHVGDEIYPSIDPDRVLVWEQADA